MSDDIIFKIRFIANTSQKREKGLMYAKSLDDNEIVLFVFPTVGNYGFWNKNVSFPLSLAFLDENGKILEFGDMKAESEKEIQPKSNEIKYVIEAPKGAFEKNEINKGDLVVYNSDNSLLIKKI